MKKKGFTLIELLAVIIILAVIALIATPIVLNVVEEAKKSAAKSTTSMILSSTKIYYSEEYFKNNGNFTGYECSILNKTGCDELPLEGEKPDKAIISIDNEGKVNGKVVYDKYTYYICNNQISEEETSNCSIYDYENIYAITNEGIITGFKTEEVASINVIEKVYASNITEEAQIYVNEKAITIPEYVGEIEVKGIASNAFNSYEITKVTILPTKKLEIGTNALPENLEVLKVKSCVEDYYYEYSNILEIISSSCVVERYKDVILNGADPELDEGMIPVIINSDGSLRKASLIDEWYNYENKKWANVVLVSEESRSAYQNAKAGSTIEIKDVLAYYVWIPRYRYEIFTNKEDIVMTETNNVNVAKLRKIVFENNETTKSTGSKKGEYLTHPAFTFGSKELNGIWVGKFETTGTVSEPTILPNVESLRNQNVSSQFKTSLLFANNTLNSDGSISHSNNLMYGINNTDAHMMKNSEWGAVAYLATSIYGQGKTEVRINNSSTYITGCAATLSAVDLPNDYTDYTNDCENTYNTEIGVLASTTGNITGIYDMNGGAQEYVMGVMEYSEKSKTPASGRNKTSNSGFYGHLSCPNCSPDDGSVTIAEGTMFPNSKYYDLYEYGKSYTDIEAYSRGKLGDATIELGSFMTATSIIDNSTRYYSNWNGDLAVFVSSIRPWFIRGGLYKQGVGSGIFNFHYMYGNANEQVSFRSVLTK